MMHSFGYSAMVLTSSHPGKMMLKMQTTVSRENSTISQRKKECSKVTVDGTSPFIVKGWLVPHLNCMHGVYFFRSVFFCGQN